MAARRWAARVLGMVLPVVGALGMAPVTAHAATGGVGFWQTTGDQSQLAAAQRSLVVTAAPATPTGELIPVDASQTFQSMDGYGAAVTDSSAWLIETKMSATKRQTLLTSLFDPVKGIGLSVVRVPMGASDMALSDYTYDDMPTGQTDPTLSHFSVAHDQGYILPLLRQIKAVNPAVEIIAAPWSAPAWMKSNDSLIGGYLNGQWTETYAQYFVKFIQAYQAAGVNIDAITPQNEPENWPADYPGMLVGATDEANFVAGTLAPALAAAGLHPAIVGYDHNWSDVTYPETLLSNTAARSALSGIAFHCYAGDPSAMTEVHDVAPEQKMYLTECSGGSWSPDFGTNLAWDSQNLIVGGPANWASDVLFWNLALDPNGGPHTGGCANCRGVVTIDPSTGAVTRNVEYWLLAQASAHVPAGSVRIASPSFGANDVDTVAFRRPDGRYTLLALNPTGGPRVVEVTWNGEAFTATLAADALATFVWSPNATMATSTSTAAGATTATGGAGTTPTGTTYGAGPAVTRLAGTDRIDTAVAASQYLYPAPRSAPTVVLARDDQYADALVGGPMAHALGGPLLLTGPTTLDPAVAAEVTRVLAPGGTVYLMGGPGALSPDVESAAAGLGGSVVRVAGPDRAATAVAAASLIPNAAAVLEVTGTGFADALAAGPAAATLGGVVLLTDGSSADPATSAYLAGHPGLARYAVGGPATLADPVATPVAGADRYATAALVAQRFFPAPATVVLAAGDTFPDALSGGPVAANADGPMLLTTPSALPASAGAYLAGVGTVGCLVVVGGTSAVPPQILPVAGAPTS